MCATSEIIQLQTILQNEDIEHLDSDEISYLQLRYMERLDIEQIAMLLDRADEEMERIAKRFAASLYHPSARSTM